MDKVSFNHKITVRVRFSEVDMLGVCNNSVYINYFEDARLDYFKQLGLMPKDGLFTDGKPAFRTGRLFFVVRNELNYRAHARYDDELIVYSKISFIKNSSFGFEHIVINPKTNEVIVDGSGVIVQVDPKTGKSTQLSIDFIEKIKQFEPSVKILQDR